jgi:integrase
LGYSEREALRDYPVIHREVEELFQGLRSKGDHAGNRVAKRTELEKHMRMVERIRQEGLDPHGTAHTRIDGYEVLDRPDWDRVGYGILDSYPIDPQTGDPVGVSEEDAQLARTLLTGRLPPQPAPSLEDAKKFYLQEKVKVGTDKEDVSKRQRIERVIQHATEALGGDRAITEIRRYDARMIRDHFLNNLGLKPATAKRYLTDLKATVSLALQEFEVEAANPFDRITIEVEGNGRDDRRPFTEAEIGDVRKKLQSDASLTLQLLWKILEGTGCRVGEITGLTKEDVVIPPEGTPHIKIRPHDHRRLKTKSSERDVPLVGEALEAAKEALREAGDSPYLFPQYALKRGNDRASAALMKHVRSVVSDPKVTNHSLRHRMTDKLRLSATPEEVVRMILGHANKGITDRYGGSEGRLMIMAPALAKATALK